MPMAQAYQFRTTWFDKHEIPWKMVGGHESALNKIIE